MSTLSGAAAAPVAGTLVTLQCDVCLPPRIATTTMAGHREAGWVLDGGVDVCPMCARRLPPSAWTPRRERPELGVDRGGAWPNFFVIGAAKAATTTLHDLLGQHRDVAMAAAKELLFFQDPDRAGRIGHYRAQFRADAAVRGESSTAYTREPFVPGVAARIAETAPDARVVYVVRDPVERAVSSYVEERVHGNDPRSFEEAFAELDPDANPYVAGSCYARQLDAYLEHFSRDQVLVLDMADVANDAVATVRRVWSFVGVDADAALADAGERLNTRRDKQEYSGAGLRLRRSRALRLVYRLPEGPRERLLAPVRRRLASPVARPEVSAPLRARLDAVFAPEIERLLEIAGIDPRGRTGRS